MKRIKLLKKQKNKDSTRWLDRHLNDEYVKKSKIDGFRSRSSYKLIQINEKFNFLKNSNSILDLGCSHWRIIGFAETCSKKFKNFRYR